MEWAEPLAVNLQSAVAVAWRQRGRRPVQRRHVRLCWIVGYWRAAAAHLIAWRSVWSAAPSASPHNRHGLQDDVRTLGYLCGDGSDLSCKNKKDGFDPHRKLS